MAGSYELVYRVSRGRKEPDDTNVRINVSPPSCRDNWPLSWFIDFFSLPFSKIIFINILNGEKKGGRGKKKAERFVNSKNLYRVNIFSDTIGCVSRLCANVALPRILASRL